MKRFLAATRLWVLALPLLIGFTGAAMNQAVIAANHDKFPVMVNARNLAAHGGADQDGLMDDVHCVMTPSTHLNFLADWIDLRDAIYSPGDLLLELGGWLWQFAPIAWFTLIILDALRREANQRIEA